MAPKCTKLRENTRQQGRKVHILWIGFGIFGMLGLVALVNGDAVMVKPHMAMKQWL